MVTQIDAGSANQKRIKVRLAQLRKQMSETPTADRDDFAWLERRLTYLSLSRDFNPTFFFQALQAFFVVYVWTDADLAQLIATSLLAMRG